MKMPLHLQRHKTTSVWYYQRRIPKDLIEANDGQPREYFSLNTRDKKEAEIKARQWDVKLDEKWALQRQQVELKAKAPDAEALTPAQIDSLASMWLEHLMTEDEEVRQEGLDERGYSKYQEMLDIVEDQKRYLARGDISLMEFEVEDFISSIGIKAEVGSASFKRICYAFLKASVRANDLMRLRHQGEAIDTPKAPVLALETYNLDDAFASWKLQKNRPEKTVKEWDATKQLFIDQHGNLPVTQITKAHVAEFRDDLLKKKLKADTIRKRLAGIRSLLERAVEHGKIEANPAQSINVERNPFDNDRQDYSLDDLRTIFSSTVFTQRSLPEHIGEAAYWVPLIALYTGARPGEILKLTPRDVCKDEPTGIYFFDFNVRGAGKSLKTAESLRKIPIHKELVRLGFVKFVDSAKDQTALFPRVAAIDAFSKWWTTYTQELGVWVKDSKVFYSFRHSFTTAARNSGIPEDFRKLFEGHTLGKGSSPDYGIYTLEAKNRWLQKLKHRGLDLTHLAP